MLASGTSLATQSCSCEGNILTEPCFLSHQTGELNLRGTTNLVSRQIRSKICLAEVVAEQGTEPWATKLPTNGVDKS